MSAKNVDRHNRFRSITVGFRVSPEEQEELNRAVALRNAVHRCQEILCTGKERIEVAKNVGCSEQKDRRIESCYQFVERAGRFSDH